MTTIDVPAKLKFERIMLATDFSRSSAIAQTYAVGLALHDDSYLELTTVIDLSMAAAAMDVLSDAALQALRRSGDEELQRSADRISGVRVTRRVIEGFQPPSLIVDEAITSKADLIVLGTSSKRGLKKLVLGSTAEEIIRTAPCPILTVGPHVPPPATWPLRFERIVYATDFSPEAAKAADLALSLGQMNRAKIYLCHVIDTKDPSRQLEDDTAPMSRSRALMPESARGWCHSECIVEHGNASDSILSVAAEVQADLIVLGARKASFWIEYIHTGLTPALLAEAACPVLTVC